MKNHTFCKYILLVVLSLILVTCTVALSACDKHQHNYAESVTKQPTCTDTGEKTYICQCGESYTETLSAIPHSYTKLTSDQTQHWYGCVWCGKADPDQVAVDHQFDTLVASEHVGATCQTTGKDVYQCQCGATEERVLPTAAHQFTVYQSDNLQHWYVCSDCGIEDATATKENHSFDVTVSTVPSTCSEKGNVTKKCACGKTETSDLPLAQCDYTKQDHDEEYHWNACKWCNKVDETTKIKHEFVIKEEIHYVGDCQTPAYGLDGCTVCGAERRFYTEQYGDHKIEFHKAQPATETYGGNVNYWQCTVCQKYFATKNCQVELTAEQIFGVLPQKINVTISQLYDVVLQMWEDNDEGPTYDYYLITATITDVDVENHALTLVDESPNSGSGWTVTFPDSLLFEISSWNGVKGTYDNSVIINKNDTIKFQANIIPDGCYVTNITVLDVEDGDDEIVDVTISGVDGSVGTVWATDSLGQNFYCGYTYFNSAIDGDTLTFAYYCWADDAVVESVTVNGTAYTLQQLNAESKIDDSGYSYVEFELVLDGDVNVVFSVVSYERFLEINYINTNVNNGQYDLNNYVSYKFSGTTNGFCDLNVGDNRIYANSGVEYTVNGAYITKIVIEFDNTNKDDLPKNVIKAGADKSHAENVSFTVNALKTTIIFSGEDVRFFSFFANKQARITKLTIYYTIE